MQRPRMYPAFIPQLAVLAVIGLCAAQLALAGDYRQFPGSPTDNRSLRVQERVEEIYASGDYDRALLIYEKELAPAGDKYAQYMVGFMHLTGQGVDEDAVAALAWYRLAAERGEPSLVEARDGLAESLAPDQLREAENRFADLWRQYGDRKLILDLVERDLEILKRRRANGRGEAETSVRLAAGYSKQEAGDPLLRRVHDRMLERLDYLRFRASSQSVGIEPDDPRIRSLEAQMRAIQRELSALGIR